MRRKMRVLACDSIHEVGIEKLEQAGFEVDIKPTISSEEPGGAALDVYEVEPPEDWTLMRLSNVVCTPHTGAQTKEAQKTASQLIAEKSLAHSNN